MRAPARQPCATFVALAAALLAALAAMVARADSGPDELKRAHDAFEYGDFAKTVELLQGVPDQVALSESERIEAYRLLGLSSFYLHRTAAAQQAMFELLKQDPDYQLDPFYVPPDAVAFFDEVRRRNEPYLAPIRERRRERKQAQAELLARRKEAERRRAAPVKPVLIERHELRSSALVAWMPFGLGQLQNGSPKLGTALLASEVGAAVVSLGSYLLIEALRSSETGRFSAANYALAQRADTVKWASGGAFYLLWLGGAIEANIDFVPTHDLGETAQLPSAAPLGPLSPPDEAAAPSKPGPRLPGANPAPPLPPKPSRPAAPPPRVPAPAPAGTKAPSDAAAR